MQERKGRLKWRTKRRINRDQMIYKELKSTSLIIKPSQEIYNSNIKMNSQNFKITNIKIKDKSFLKIIRLYQKYQKKKNFKNK
jgi:hypothetical protein